MQDEPAQVNQFGGTQDNQLGTYPIPPSILADDHQTKLQAQTSTQNQTSSSQTPTDEPIFSQITQTPLPQPEPKKVHSTQPAPITPLIQPESQIDQPIEEEPVKVKNSPAPSKLNQVKDPTPPVGSPEEADHYINTLIKLIDHDKIEVDHTDLEQFDPSTLQDHYRILFDDYEIEVSHAKAADSDKEFYVLLFNELDNVQGVCVNKNILGYIHLTPAQFGQFKNSADGYLNKKKIAQEHDRFVQSLEPITNHLNTLSAQLPQETEPTEENQEFSDNPIETQTTTYDDNGLDSNPNQQILDDTEQDQPEHTQPMYDPSQSTQPNKPDDNSSASAQQLDQPESEEQNSENQNSPFTN